MNVHLFGGTWCPSCSFALHKTASDSEQDFIKDTVNTVIRNFYVDDCLKSVEDEAMAVRITQELISLLEKGGFRLTKFMSNIFCVLQGAAIRLQTMQLRNILRTAALLRIIQYFCLSQRQHMLSSNMSIVFMFISNYHVNYWMTLWQNQRMLSSCTGISARR